MKKLITGVLVALLMVGSIMVTGCFDGQTTTTQSGNGDQMTTVQVETENQDETTTEDEMAIEEETTDE